MSTLWLMTTAHSSAAQKRGNGAPGGSSRPLGWLCEHEATSAMTAMSHPRLRPDPTDATYQVCSRVGELLVAPRLRRGAILWAVARAEKIIVWSIVAAIAFALGMVLFVNDRIKASREAAEKAANAEAAPSEKRPSMLDAAVAVAVPFVASVGAGRFAGAYELMASPYRSAVTRAAFEAACRASPILAGARSVTLNRLRQQNTGTASSIEASGVLDSSAGAVPIGFVFLREAGQLRILVVSLAGVPVLQGVAPR
jgi:hypothetical protein